jgi:hypothetical protein
LLGEPTDEPRGLIQIQPGWVGLQFVASRERAGDAPLDWLDVVVFAWVTLSSSSSASSGRPPARRS